MIKVNSVFRILFLSSAILVTFIVSAQDMLHESPQPKVGPLKYYLTHMVSGVSCYAFVQSVLFLVRLDLALRFTGDANFKQDVLHKVKLLICLLLVYKEPQWTDTYLLNIDKDRTSTDDIINLVCKLFLPYYLVPVGVMGSEVYVRETNGNSDVSDFSNKITKFVAYIKHRIRHN